MTPADFFAAASTTALVAWVALAATLFLPAIRTATWRITGVVLPALLAVAYVWLLSQGLGQGGEGGFGSIEAVRALFANDSALTAGWLHYLAFDLFVGTWIARTGSDARVPALLLLPCLALTFLAGPAGLLLFLVLRFAVQRVRGGTVAP